MNQFKAWLFMALLTVLLVLLGNAIAGQGGMIVFFLIALAMNFFGYWFSDRVAIMMTGSRPVTEAEAPQLYASVRKLTRAAGLPMPKIYITPSDQPNAFATGRNPSHAAVAVTEGILRILSREELEGVLAHELAHVKNRDILISSMAAVVAGAITMLANVAQWGLLFGGSRDDEDESPLAMVGTLLMIILAPIAAMLIQLAISRSREYGADATGARIVGSPHGLANALLKLERGAGAIPMDVSPSAAHMFIVNPLSAEGFARLFSTHPPIQDRVERLRGMRINA
ncbi:MAG: zinc metalloprotease HtpX [Syntrophothermus sp.]